MVNEITLYLLCMLLLMMLDIWNNFDCSAYTVIGGLFMGLLLLNIVYNVYVIVRYTYDHLKLYKIRRENIIENRQEHKSREKLTSRAVKKHQKCQHMRSKENQHTWDKQWQKMSDNRDGWLKQEALGKRYIWIYEYTIQRKTEVCDREEKKEDIPMLPIKEAPKSESESKSSETPPPTPKEEVKSVKSDAFPDSGTDDFIPDNIYEDADAKAGELKEYVSQSRRDIADTVSKHASEIDKMSQSRRDSVSSMGTVHKPVRIVNGLPVLEPEFVEKPKKKLTLLKRPSIILTAPEEQETILYDAPWETFNPMMGPANIKAITERTPPQQTVQTRVTTITSDPPAYTSTLMPALGAALSQKPQVYSTVTTTTQNISVPDAMAPMRSTPLRETAELSSSAQNFRPRHEIGNLLTSAAGSMDPRMTF